LEKPEGLVVLAECVVHFELEIYNKRKRLVDFRETQKLKRFARFGKVREL
jgi:hypothetical protein